MQKKRTYEELGQRVKELEKESVERKRGEDALWKSEEKFRLIAENIRDVFYINDPEKKQMLYVSPAYEEIWGRTCESLYEQPMSFVDEIHPEDRERVIATFEKQKRGEAIGVEYRIVRPDGSVRWIMSRAYPVRNELGEFECIVGIAEDISERKQAEEHIRTLTQQLMKAQEGEWRRISRELHDNVAQDLSTAKIACETLFDNEPAVPSETRQRVLELCKILQGTIMAVRDLSYDLRPPSMDQLGLVRTVFQYCEDFSDKNGVRVDFYSAGMDDLRLDFNTAINLYRLIQEGLNNIRKHADASHVTIRLVASSPNIILRVEDDGKGFDVKDRLITALHEKHMGLRSMEERVSLLQGKMRIQSRPMQGTKIFVEVPYKEKKSGSKEKHIDR